MALDLSNLLINDTYKLQLRHPATDELLYSDNDETKPVTITLNSTSSKPYRQVLERIVKRNAAVKGNAKKSLATIREESEELLVACSVTSENLEWQGEPVTTPDAFAAVYKEPALSWIRDQVDAALSDTANFINA